MPARAVPDGDHLIGGDRQLGEQVKAGRDVRERSRPPSAGGRAPVLEVPGRVPARGQVGGQRTEPRQSVLCPPEPPVQQHHGPQRRPFRQPQLPELRWIRPVPVDNRICHASLLSHDPATTTTNYNVYTLTISRSPSPAPSVALPPLPGVVYVTSKSSQHDAPPADTLPADTPVAIVGAGPVGMFLALDLASKGVRSTVIDRSTSHRLYPKGDTHNARTMEHYRRLGLAGAIRAVGLPPEHPTDVVYLTRLNGYELKRLRMPTGAEKMAEVAAHSATSQVPEPLHRSNQVHVEKVVFEHLLRADAVTCRLGTEFLGFEESADGVRVRVRPAEGGPEETISC